MIGYHCTTPKKGKMDTSRLEELCTMTADYQEFDALNFLDWALWKCKIQFQVIPVGYNGGWSLHQVDPAPGPIHVNVTTATVKECIWEAAQKLKEKWEGAGEQLHG